MSFDDRQPPYDAYLLRRGRVWADLWDVERFLDCPRCGAARAAALEEVNLTQQPAPRIECSCTGTR